ncbi:hypothetical protein V7S43_013209 [Phytophthora oleae]|uniref:Subtilisin n=1 Tax=Phytophthora oleae TaxID=2107226 RepID=A0ABD3F8B8_9STRA
MVIEAATIQVASLADFHLDPETHMEHSVEAIPSSQSTVTDPSPPSTPRPRFLHTMDTRSSQSTITEPSTPKTPEHPTRTSLAGSHVSAPRTPQPFVSSQAFTVEIPWTPQGASRAELRRLGIDAAKIPPWFAECYDSDGYDTDALICLAKTAPLSPAKSLVSSPGFAIVGATDVHSARDEWGMGNWPNDVVFLESNYNPHNWKFSAVSAGFNGGGDCGCKQRCNALTAQTPSARAFLPRRIVHLGELEETRLVRVELLLSAETRGRGCEA